MNVAFALQSSSWVSHPHIGSLSPAAVTPVQRRSTRIVPCAISYPGRRRPTNPILRKVKDAVAPVADTASVSASNVAETTSGNVQKLVSEAKGTEKMELLAFRDLGVRSAKDDAVIDNAPDSETCFAIFKSVAKNHKGHIDADAAKEALALYADAGDKPFAGKNLLSSVSAGDISYIVKIDGKYIA